VGAAAVDFDIPRQDMPHDKCPVPQRVENDRRARPVLTKAQNTRRYRTAKQAASEGSTLREAALRSGKVNEEEDDKVIVPTEMIGEGSAEPDVASGSRSLVAAFHGPEQGASQ
jgi:hypothetical protein